MDRAGSRVLAASAPAVLLAVDPWGWYPFGPVKWLLVLVLGFGGAALVLRDATPQVPRPLALVLGGFLAWMVLAAAFGDDPLYAWTGTPERHLGVLTWALCALLLVVGTALGERGARTVVDGLLVAGLGVGAVAMAEGLGWEPQVLDVASRLSGSLGSPAYLGAAAALLLPVALGAAVGATSRPQGTFLRQDSVETADFCRRNVRWWRVVAWSAVVLLAVACVGSGARAAWVGLLGAGVVTAVAAGGPIRAWLRARLARAAVVGGGAALALALLVVLSPVGARLGDATDPDSAGGRGRLDEWRVAANVIVDHPVVGVGPEGYRTAFHEGVDERYEREHGRRQQPDRAHSVVLDLALAGGIPLVAAWLALVAIVGRSMWAALKTGPPWLRGVATGLVAHVAGQLLLFPIVELEPVAWLLAGIVVAHAAPAPQAAPASHPTRTGARSSLFAARFSRKLQGWGWGFGWWDWGWWQRWVSLALGGLALGALLASATDVVADHRAERAVDALARGDHRAAAVAAGSAADLRPDIVRLHLLAARAAVADEQGALAGLQRVDDARAVSPRDPIVLLQRLTLLVQRAESTQTAAHLAEARRAIDARRRVDPYAAALWRLDARLARVEGDPEAAERAEARADELTPPEERR